MRVGGLYKLTVPAKKSLIKKTERFSTQIGISTWFFEEAVKNQYRMYPMDTVVFVLELHQTSLEGKPLKGTTSRRLKVLLPDGKSATMFADTTEWEEVKQ